MKARVMIITALIAVSLVCAAIIVFVLFANTSRPSIEGNIKVNDFVTFGSYYGEPILWKCVEADPENGIMLLSENIITLKAYDAAESGAWLGQGGEYSTDLNEQQYGSKVWATSNLREWLNSDATVVTYTTQPPVAEAIIDGENAYADEAGFLTNLTQEERGMLMPVTHDNCTDLVYILNYDEVVKYISMGDDPFYASMQIMTEAAAENCTYDMTWGKSLEWWCFMRSSTRTDPDEKDLSTFGAGNFYYNYHVFYGVYPCTGSGGVLPAVNLNTDHCVAGDGTIENPWVIGRSGDRVIG